MRLLCAILLLVLGGSGCTQTPDYVAGATLLDEAGTGGASGMTGGSGGTGGSAGSTSDECAGPMARAAVMFDGIARDCEYETSDSELHALLEQYIYSIEAPVVPFSEAENRDGVCEGIDALPEALRFTRWPLRYRYELIDNDITRPNMRVTVICPRYCQALRDWSDEYRDLALECLR